MPPDPDSPSNESERATPWRRPASRIRPASALGDRLLLECARRDRHGVPFSLIGVHHVLWEDHGRDERTRLREHVLQNVSDLLRVSDAVYHAGLPGCHVVVLPHTPPNRADVVLRRIETQARDAASADVGPVSVEPITVETGAGPADLLDRVEAHFRETSLRPLGPHARERPAPRLPVGNLERLEEALHTEINLAGRDGTSLSVVALAARASDDAVPGLLACDVDEIAARTVRGCDQVFEVTPTCVALVLARTRPEEAAVVATRLVGELAEEHPDAPYGTPVATVLEFDRLHPDAAAFVRTLRRLAG